MVYKNVVDLNMICEHVRLSEKQWLKVLFANL